MSSGIPEGRHEPVADARLPKLFETALELPRAEREEFVAAVCRDDEALGVELKSLLDAHDGAEGYFGALAEHVVGPTLSEMARVSGEQEGSALLQRLQTGLAGAYRIERELAGGGMSRVFLAQDVSLKRPVVIKVPPRETIPQGGTERFQREMELEAQLQHPHIVPLLATGVVDGTSYYTMPFVTGETLRERLYREGPLGVDVAIGIWRDVLDALAYAHAFGVIHCDIKPANILLSGRNALVTDFGIARAIAAAAPSDFVPAPTVGTPAYLAPEQVAGREDEADPRADIYQAGLVMYEMLAGELPFQGTTRTQLAQARLMGEPRALVAPEAPGGLVELVMRCLARDPAARPPTADAVLAELDARTQGALSARPSRRLAILVPGVVAAITGAALVVTLRGAPSTLDSSRYTPDVAAHEWYARGMEVALLRTGAGQRQAVSHFEQAIGIDPSYAAAWAGIARMSIQIWNAASNDERALWIGRAEQAALHAVALDESDPDAQAALGWVRLVTGDWAGAETALTLAINLDPRVARGHEGLARVYMMTGQPRRQLMHARLGVEADPFSHSAIREWALALATNDRCEEALDDLEALKTLTPPASVGAVVGGMCLASTRRWEEAIAEFRWAYDLGESTFAQAFLGYALARVGKLEDAHTILSDLLDGRAESHGAFGIATVYAGLGDHDRAFAWLERALDEGSVNSYVMHPMFADLQRDRRFDHVLERLGVPRPRGRGRTRTD